MKNCMQIYEGDNIATVLATVETGDMLTILNAKMESIGSIRASQNIPFAHKIALEAIGAGMNIMKFGERIGRATCPIGKGEYVHVHNVVSVEGSPAGHMADGLGEI